MRTHSHGHPSPVQTEGRLIRWAALYDALPSIEDMIKSRTTPPRRFPATLPLHHRYAQFSAEDLSQLMQKAKFETIKQPDLRFLASDLCEPKSLPAFEA